MLDFCACHWESLFVTVPIQVTELLFRTAQIFGYDSLNPCVSMIPLLRQWASDFITPRTHCHVWYALQFRSLRDLTGCNHTESLIKLESFCAPAFKSDTSCAYQTFIQTVQQSASKLKVSVSRWNRCIIEIIWEFQRTCRSKLLMAILFPSFILSVSSWRWLILLNRKVCDANVVETGNVESKQDRLYGRKIRRLWCNCIKKLLHTRAQLKVKPIFICQWSFVKIPSWANV